MTKYALIALGANQDSAFGPPKKTLRAAIRALSLRGVLVHRISRFYRSPCFPSGTGPDYVNAAIAVQASGTAAGMLRQLHDIEAEFGREREQRWGMRVLDLDLLSFGGAVHPNAGEYNRWRDLPLEEQMRDAPGQMILPHPRIQDRAFVLAPVRDIAPDWVHPVIGQSVTAMLDARPPDEVASLAAL